MPNLDAINPNEYPVDMVWDAMQKLLEEQLPGVDVAAAGEKDFDDDGQLIIQPPSVRGLFAGETAETEDVQHMTYAALPVFDILCIDEDVSSDTQAQRRSSLRLAARVKHILAGAKLVIAPASEGCEAVKSDAVIYRGMMPVPTANIGMGYAVAFGVPGIAQFDAPNA
jgi:hypothetical protein